MVGIGIERVHLTGPHLEDVPPGNRVPREIHPMRSRTAGYELQQVEAVTGRRGDIDVHFPLPQPGKLDHLDRRAPSLRMRKAKFLDFIFDEG